MPASPSWCIWSSVGWFSTIKASSMVIAGAANVGVVGEQLALRGWPGRMRMEAVLEDRLNGAVGSGADVEAAVAGRFQPLGAVLPCQAQDADAGAVALLGVRPAFQDQRGELGGARADRRRVDGDALDRPFGVPPVPAPHVLGDLP